MKKPEIKKINRLLLAYLSISVVFSIAMVLRLLSTNFYDEGDFFKITGLVNIVFYDLYYYVFPITHVIVLAKFVKCDLTDNPKIKTISNLIWVLFFSQFIFFWLDIILSSVFLYSIPLIVLLLSTYFTILSCSSLKTQFSRKKIVAILLTIILLPNLSALLGFSIINNYASELETDSEKVNYISETVLNSHTPFWGSGSFYYSPHRAYDDIFTFLIIGVGSCRELGYSSMAFLNSLGYETRPVSFPGEDHMFAEVNLDGDWFVVDPGYANMTMVTQEERGNARIKEMGGLSYAVANIDTNPEIITNSYTTTDEILLKIVKGDVPQPEVEVVLKHKFRGMTLSLPELSTDSNGEVIFELGIMNYNRTSIEPAEKFYWVYVDGKNTTNTVHSTGSGKSHQIVIEVE